MQGYSGLTFSYAWKLYLPSTFTVSGAFCHLHQIKYDGNNVQNPNITLTARSYVQLEDIDKNIVLTSIPLSDFKGNWIQIREVVTFGNNGYLNFIATRIKDGATLLSYNNKA